MLKCLYDVPAPAKLNLFLHIVGRRPDGYHLLQSVFVPIDWCDTLHFERRDDGRIARHDLGAVLPADDLCLRAARALQAASGSRHGVDISIRKEVPWGAGLGGGSSDAASTLLALNRLWGLNWSRSRLMELAVTLGADLPFFLGDGPAWVEGIGERLTPLRLAGERFYVVKPKASLPTAEIFRSPLLARDSSPAIVMDFLAQQSGFGKNDMQAAAQALCAEVEEAAVLLKSRFGNSRMTGSGSAVFARVQEKIGVENDVAFVEDIQLPEGWIGRQCRSLESHPLKGWLTD